MSILFDNNEDVLIISHEQFIQRIYDKTEHLKQVVSFTLKNDLFNIVHPYLRDMQFQSNNFSGKEMNNRLNIKGKMKNKLCGDCSKNEVEFVSMKYSAVIEDENIRKAYFNSDLEITDLLSNNIEARNASKIYFENLSDDTGIVFNGRNDNNYAITVVIGDKVYVIPPMCEFYNCDVLNLSSKLSDDIKFDFIVLDPPWWNKYIRRKRKLDHKDGYRMMYNPEISSIPIKRLISNDGLVAVWCTNSQRHKYALINEIFPSWGLKYISSWYWVKVTKRGEPVCKFSEPPGKQPYERIIFGCRPERNKFYDQPQDMTIIISTPSAIHSHKPPLTDLMNKYLGDSPRCLELFARYLLPGWTSCGNQVLSLQNLNLYSMKENINKNNTENYLSVFVVIIICLAYSFSFKPIPHLPWIICSQNFPCLVKLCYKRG